MWSVATCMFVGNAFGAIASDLPGDCSVTASPESTASSRLEPGTQVTLTAHCSTGSSPITYAWNIGVIGASLTVAPSVTSTYTIIPSNASGNGPSFQITVYSTGTSTTQGP